MTRAIVLGSSLLIACPDVGPDPTATASTSSATSTGSEQTTTSTGPTPTTTSPATDTSGSSSTDPDTGGECYYAGIVTCDEVLDDPDFCSALYHAAKLVGIVDPYALILYDNCVAGQNLCDLCRDFKSYCIQLVDPVTCEFADDKCLCVSFEFNGP